MENQDSYLEYHVIDMVQAQQFAARFFDQHTEDTEYDLHARRAIMRKFQKRVMDVFHDDLLHSATIDDDFLNDDDPDVVDTYQIYKAFTQMFPRYDVISIIPMTITGAVGFVVQFKPM